MHDFTLIATIAMSLMFALGFGWVAARLHLSPLVGYLVAGIAVGPFTPGFVADGPLAQQLAEVGVILLMFGVGLHFSVRDLWAVRRIAIPGALGQIAAATAIGTTLSWLWGWGLIAGVVFGLALSTASTVVLLRALEERGIVQSHNGHIAVGWLVVEDLAMVVALVLLPAVASLTGTAAAPPLSDPTDIASTLGLTLAKVAMFIALVMLVGRRVVPWILDQVARQGSRELFTLAVLALALGIAYLSSSLFGVSFALGAFFAGVIMSESDLSQKAAADSLPLKDAFAVLFFVSVGMLFDPRILLADPLAVLAVLLVIIIGKSLAAFGIVLLFRYPVSTALIVSASLAQIGEFSFILGALGVSLGLLPPAGMTYILSGALLSIALNPLVFHLVGPLERWIRRHPRLTSTLEHSTPDPLAHLPVGTPVPDQHVLIIGHGRVGSLLAEAMHQANVPSLLVEQNRAVVTRLREEGRLALCGDGAVMDVLQRAHLERARLLIVAIPDGFAVRRIVEGARHVNPQLDIVVRTHSDEERETLERLGVDHAVMGERELAFAMMDTALRCVGVSDAEAVVAAFRRPGVLKDPQAA